MTASPMQRSLAYCKAQGWLAWVAERWNSHARVHQDAFGFGDLLVCLSKLTLVQATSGAHHAEREHKILEQCGDAARAVMNSGGAIEVWSWAKRGARGKRKLWTLRRSELLRQSVIEHREHEALQRQYREEFGPMRSREEVLAMRAEVEARRALAEKLRQEDALHWLEVEEQEP